MQYTLNELLFDAIASNKPNETFYEAPRRIYEVNRRVCENWSEGSHPLCMVCQLECYIGMSLPSYELVIA